MIYFVFIASLSVNSVSSSGRFAILQPRMPYSLPRAATPFTLNFPDEEYLQLQQLLRLSRIGPVTWENQHEDGRYGVPRDWLLSAKDYWLTRFDWRAEERRINSFFNYKLRVEDQKDDVNLHFVALLSTREDAIPLVLLHEWPGSFLEFLPLLELAREKYSSDALPFHIIVPSLPGYTLSSGPPPDKAWVAEDAARIIHNGLQMLNFRKYVVQGRDVGSLIASILATEYGSVIGIHCECLSFFSRSSEMLTDFVVNLLPSLDRVESTDPGLTPWDIEAVEQSKKHFATPTSGAAIMNSTRPATLGTILSSNPMAYLFGKMFKICMEISTNSAKDRREVPRMARKQVRYKPHLGNCHSLLAYGHLASLRLHISQHVSVRLRSHVSVLRQAFRIFLVQARAGGWA